MNILLLLVHVFVCATVTAAEETKDSAAYEFSTNTVQANDDNSTRDDPIGVLTKAALTKDFIALTSMFETLKSEIKTINNQMHDMLNTTKRHEEEIRKIMHDLAKKRVSPTPIHVKHLGACKRIGTFLGRYTTLKECAEIAFGKSSMFTFGTNYQNGSGCSDGKCQCYTQHTDGDGYCEEIDDPNNHLYKFPSKNVNFELVAEKRECQGNGLWRPRYKTLAECSQSCFNKASMFSFAMNEDPDYHRCYMNDDGELTCRCMCETSATSSATCNVVWHPGYRLYKYV